MTTYYLYEEKTGLYAGKVEASSIEQLNLIVSSIGLKATDIEPSKDLLNQVDKYHKLLFDQSKKIWRLVADYRGTWWNKKTKEKLVIDKIGVEVNLEEYTDKEPCPYCVWDNEKNDWVIDLNLYKEAKVKEVLDEFYKYLYSREPILHQLAITGIMVRSLTILSTNKQLKEEDINLLSQIIEDCDIAFRWISSITEYELSLEEKIKSASSVEEVDKIVASMDYSQFDSTYRYITIGDKVTAISKIALTGGEEPQS